jgi:hypothetical protein
VQGGKGLYRLGYVSREQAGVARVLAGKLPRIRVFQGTAFGARLALAI